MKDHQGDPAPFASAKVDVRRGDEPDPVYAQHAEGAVPLQLNLCWSRWDKYLSFCGPLERFTLVGSIAHIPEKIFLHQCVYRSDYVLRVLFL